MTKLESCMTKLCDNWQQQCSGLLPSLTRCFVFAAALRIALASAGVEELRIVAERRRKCNQHCNADHTTIHPASDGENSDSFGGQRGQPQPQIDPARRQSLEASLHFDSIPQHSAVGCSFPRTRSSVSASAAAVAVQRSCDADRNNHMQQPRRRSSDDSSGTSRWTACNGEASHRHRFALGLEEARTDCDSTASVSSMSTDSGAPCPWVLAKAAALAAHATCY